MAGRSPGSYAFTREQFVAALETAHERLGHRRRGWHSEADIAEQIGICRQTLRTYRRRYGFPPRLVSHQIATLHAVSGHR